MIFPKRKISRKNDEQRQIFAKDSPGDRHKSSIDKNVPDYYGDEQE